MRGEAFDRLSLPREAVIAISALEATQIGLSLCRLRLWLRGDNRVRLTDGDLAALERAYDLIHEMGEQARRSSDPPIAGASGWSAKGVYGFCANCRVASDLERSSVGNGRWLCKDCNPK